jgi:HEAT repeat protein
MADQMNNESIIANILEMLTSADRRRRLTAAEEVGDVLQYDAERPDAHMITREQRRVVATHLVDAIVAEQESHEVQEAMLNALSWGSSNDLDVCWGRLIECLPHFDGQLLEHALTVLGNTGDQAFEHVLLQYCDSQDLIVKSAAEDALTVLRLGGCCTG